MAQDVDNFLIKLIQHFLESLGCTKKGLWRRGWDSNPRGVSRPLPVFKTGAFNRSATLPLLMLTKCFIARRRFAYLQPFCNPCNTLCSWNVRTSLITSPRATLKEVGRRISGLLD